MFRHVLISATYESDSAVTSSDVTRILREGFEERDYDLHQIMSYQMPYPQSPMAAGLRDGWMRMTDVERRRLSESFPELYQPLLILLGVEDPVVRTPDSGRLGAES
jgi:hypothetical protein